MQTKKCQGDGSLDNIFTHSQYDRIRPVRQLSCLIIRQGLDEENEKRTPFQGGVKRTVPLTYIGHKRIYNPE